MSLLPDRLAAKSYALQKEAAMQKMDSAARS